uniref:Uncharacterized protein n=1 Tax=Arundo donax TaxID=35708 RepID=A0A0A9G177_ARUDO
MAMAFRAMPGSGRSRNPCPSSTATFSWRALQCLQRLQPRHPALAQSLASSFSQGTNRWKAPRRRIL